MRERHYPIYWNLEYILEHILHFARLEAELRHKEAQSLSDQSSGSVGGSDQARRYYLTAMCGLCKWIEINKSLTAGDFGSKKRTDKITQTRD